MRRTLVGRVDLQCLPREDDRRGTLIRSLPGTEDLYWVRLFYCNPGDGAQVTEVLLNNEDWDAAQLAVAALPWERHPWFYSARVFLVLRRAVDLG